MRVHWLLLAMALTGMVGLLLACGDDDDDDDGGGSSDDDNDDASPADDDDDDNDDTGLPVIDASNVANLAVVQELSGHTSGVYALAWSPDGATLASSGGDDTIRLWDAATWDAIVLEGHGASVWGLAWSPDNAQIASAGLDATFRIWDAASGAQTASYPLTGLGAYSLAWSPDGAAIAVGRADGYIVVFDVASATATQEIEAHTTGGVSTEIIAMRFSPDGTRLISGSINFAICVWNAASWERLAEVRVDTTARDDINGLAWAHGGSSFASAGQDGYARVWDAETYAQQSSARHGPLGAWTRGVSWTLGDDVLFVTGQGTEVGAYDAATGASLAQLAGHGSSVWAADVSPDGALAATGGGLYESSGGDTAIRIWAVAD